MYAFSNVMYVMLFQVEGVWDAPSLFEVPTLFDDKEQRAASFRF